MLTRQPTRVILRRVIRWHHGVLSALALAGLPVLPGLGRTCLAAEPDLPATYQPARMVSGVIRIWGHGSYNPSQDFIEALVLTWEAGFRKQQPNVSFENHLNGTAAAIGALYAGAGDLALMGREIWPPEVTAFTEVFGYAPTGLNVLTGSFDVRNRGYAIVIFVNKDNPLAGVTLRQLDAIYGIERRRGGPALRTWGDFGLTGEWRDKKIDIYGLPIARGFAEYFEQTVFLGGHKWRAALREFADKPGSKGGATDGGQRMLDAMAGDRYGIGYAGLLYHNPQVKPVALAQTDTGPFVAPTRDSVLDHSYPLTRMIGMYLNKAPGKPADPKLAEFLRYVLSREAQEAVLREGRGYLPILAPFARTELRKLED
jgi:phosphate transport system substrate-binding protein